MQVITIASRKGGAGKSLLSTHLSVIAATPEAPALLIDTDPQSSLGVWYALRTDKTPLLAPCPTEDDEESARFEDRLAGILEDARQAGVERVIIDTPPYAKEGIKAAMKAADIVLVPTRPGVFDIAAVAATLDIADQAGKKPLTIINHAPPKRPQCAEPSIVAEARGLLANMGAVVADCYVAERAPFGHSLISGHAVSEFEPKGKAAKEIRALWNEIQTKKGNKQ